MSRLAPQVAVPSTGLQAVAAWHREEAGPVSDTTRIAAQGTDESTPGAQPPHPPGSLHPPSGSFPVIGPKAIEVDEDDLRAALDALESVYLPREIRRRLFSRLDPVPCGRPSKLWSRPGDDGVHEHREGSTSTSEGGAHASCTPLFTCTLAKGHHEWVPSLDDGCCIATEDHPVHAAAADDHRPPPEVWSTVDLPAPPARSARGPEGDRPREGGAPGGSGPQAASGIDAGVADHLVLDLTEVERLQRLEQDVDDGERRVPPLLPPPVPGDELPPIDLSAIEDPDRLAELRATGLLDSGPEEPFDRITRLAERLLDVPVAMITLVDRDRQFFKSQVGLSGEWEAARQSPLTHSFCQYAVTTRSPLVVDDARDHPLVGSNLAVEEQGVTAYAGEPLETSNGHVLGALCVISPAPRDWQPDELQLLSELSALAVTEIDYRLRTRALRELETLSGAMEEPLAQLGESVRSMVALADRADDPLVGRFATAASTRLGWVEAAAEDLARSLSSGPVDGTNMVVALSHRIQRAVKIASHSVVDRDIELEVDGESLLVECDPHALDRAVSNVFVVVMQYADPGQPVRVSLVRDGPIARLHVRAGGPMPTSDLTRMVAQLRDPLPPSDEDAGAGLRVAGGVTTAHNGPVEGATGPEGTTFSITFVLAHLEDQAARTSRSDPPSVERVGAGAGRSS